ncbi:MAG: hypothetical protein KC593_19325 [Myxococcales bacterium]|nr:hypothetical protein [Myxococcales bacterium]MCB9627174.1 hypothetical protein [Sandaracinaceae bacterium]
MSRVFMVGTLGVVLGTALGCGPSMRMIHESDTYYERCYAADVDPGISVELRRECWARWLEHYTPGQPPDRVAHARSRHAELEAGVTAPPLPGTVVAEVLEPEPSATPTEGDAGVGAVEAATEGAPVAADGSDTGVPRPDSPEVRAAYHSPPPVTNTTACDPLCRVGWDDCIPRCDDRTRACRAACQAQYRACQAGCY